MEAQLPVRDLRLVIRAGAILKTLGLADQPVEAAIETARRQVCNEKGVRQYVFELLGGAAHKPVENVVLFRDGVRLSVPREWAEMSLAEYLTTCFDEDSLPDKVVISGSGRGGQTLHL
jgi:hypothetical protein